MPEPSLHARFWLVISSLVLAAALLVGFKSPDEIALAVTARSGGTPDPTEQAAPTAPPRTARATATAGPTPTAAGGGTTPRATQPPTTQPTQAPVVAGGQVFTGTLVQTRYGPVQVQVTVVNGAIADIAAVRLPTGGRSGSISTWSSPVLRNEALTAKSASIQIVSGATYTSRAYQASLQAALDAAHG